MKKQKRATISAKDAIKRIETMLPLIAQNVDAVMALESTFKAANELVEPTPNRKRPKRTWDGAGTYGIIMNSLLLSLALSLARLFDAGNKRFKPNKRDIASLPSVLRLLKQKRCRSVFLAKARKWTPQFPEMADKNEAAADRHIGLAVAAFKALTGTPKGKAALVALKRFRDKRLAHSLITPYTEVRPIIKQLFDLTEVAVNVLFHIRLAVEGSNLDPAGTRRELSRQAYAFWKPAVER